VLILNIETERVFLYINTHILGRRSEILAELKGYRYINTAVSRPLSYADVNRMLYSNACVKAIIKKPPNYQLENLF
jgi:hypothetical protein